MSEYLKIELTGCDGSYWCLAGPGMGQQGVTMSPGIQQFIDAPVKTLWVPGPFGQQYAGKRVQRRDMVFSVQAYDEDEDTWATVDSAWRWAWDYDKEGTMTVTTSDGVRSIGVRLLEEPKAYGDKDPHLTSDAPTVMTIASSFPYWTETTTIIPWSTLNTSDRVEFDISNDGDVPVWLRWDLTDVALWTLPDFSWGNNMNARGVQDQGRVLALPLLVAGEDLSVDSDPRVQTIIAANGNPVQNRWKGNDLLYPVMPGKTGKIPVTVSAAANGAALKLYIPRWFSRPWSRPRRIS